MAENKAVAERPKYEVMAMQAREAFLKIADEKVWAKEIMFAVQLLRGNDLLQKCDGPSIQNAVINLALTGATLNPVMAQAYLVPRGGKCCLDFSYRGLAGIAMDSGSVKHIAPRLVYTFDTFTYEEIDGEPHVRHSPSLNPPAEFTKGPEAFWDHLVCGYVVATLHDGTKIVTQPLPKWKLEKAMKTSKTSSGQTPWRTHPDEMCLKTLVKHAYKLLPQTDRMSQAVAVLNEHEGLEHKPAGNLMDRFGFDPENAEIIPPGATTKEPEQKTETEPCEFCQRTDGQHESACPNHPSAQE